MGNWHMQGKLLLIRNQRDIKLVLVWIPLA